MDRLLQAWDGVELWLVTLPFAVQVAVMVVVGGPLFAATAPVVDRVADLVVGLSRASVRDGVAGRDDSVGRGAVWDGRE